MTRIGHHQACGNRNERERVCHQCGCDMVATREHEKKQKEKEEKEAKERADKKTC